jgi:hypothetical protein
MIAISARVMGMKPSFTKLSMRSFLSILNLKVTIINHSSLACNLCVDIPRPLKNFTANPRGQIIFRVSRLLIFLSEPILDLYMKIGREQVSAAWAVILTPTFPHLRLLTSAPAFSGETPFTADELVGDKI